MGEFKMPSLGADMTAGTLLEWRVKPGEQVKRGDIVAVVDTSKAEIEVEIFEAGMIDELLVGEGERVPVGTVLATLKAAGEGAAAAATEPVQGAEPAPVAEPAEPKPRAEPLPAPDSLPAAHHHDGRHRASPLAVRIAERLGVDLADVRGTGPGGAIVRADVERASNARTEAPDTAAREVPGTAAKEAPDTAAQEVPGTAAGEPPDTAAREVPGRAATASGASLQEAAQSRHAAMRQAIGALMGRSKREIPHYYLQREIDITAASDWLTNHNRQVSPKQRLLPAALLLAAVAQSARELREMNGFWLDGGFQVAESVHLGVAISLRGGGLIAPAIRNAETLRLDELMAALRDLVSRARAGTLRSSEMSAPTITVTNLGEQGADLVHGVIYPPQVALVGFGSIRERPWASGGMLAARPTVIATLAADHRASDGHAGSRFLAAIEQRIHDPESLAKNNEEERT